MVGLSKNATLVARNIFPTNFLNGGSTKKMSCSHGSGVKRKELILTEGAPGSGKSTLLWYMCQKWATGEMFQEFSLVIHITLREYSTI